MSLSSTEKQLISNAIKTLPQNVKKFVYENLSQMVEISPWARNTLFSSLKQGLLFSTDSSISNRYGQKGFMAFSFKKNIIFFNLDYLNSTIPANAMNGIFISSIRHELKHTLDIRFLLENNMDVYDHLNQFATITNSLINQIHCVFRTLQVNTGVLDRLFDVLNHASNNFIVADYNSERFDLILDSIKYFGTDVYDPETPSHHIVNLWRFTPSSTTCLVEITADLYKVDALFTATKATRANFLEIQAIEKKFLAYFSKGLPLFTSLLPNQRRVLEILLLVVKRIKSNIPGDANCFKLFNSCVGDNNTTDCVTKYLNCWNNSPLSDQDKVHANLNLLEIAGPWFERVAAESPLFNDTMFDGLCGRNAAVKSHTPNATPTFNIAEGACYTFINETVRSYTNYRKLSYPALMNLAILFLLLTIYDLAKGYFWDKENNISILISNLLTDFLLISFLHVVGNLLDFCSLKISAHSRPVISAVVLGTNVILQGPRVALPTLVTSIAVNVPAAYLAKSISKGLGWQIELGSESEQQSARPTIKKNR